MSFYTKDLEQVLVQIKHWRSGTLYRLGTLLDSHRVPEHTRESYKIY
jgi:hypothetical protein